MIAATAGPMTANSSTIITLAQLLFRRAHEARRGDSPRRWGCRGSLSGWEMSIIRSMDVLRNSFLRRFLLTLFHALPSSSLGFLWSGGFPFAENRFVTFAEFIGLAEANSNNTHG
jgi:hypothetical protein